MGGGETDFLTPSKELQTPAEETSIQLPSKGIAIPLWKIIMPNFFWGFVLGGVAGMYVAQNYDVPKVEDLLKKAQEKANTVKEEKWFKDLLPKKKSEE